jgi:hypothetical protein
MKKITIILSIFLLAIFAITNSYSSKSDTQPPLPNGLVTVTVIGSACITNATGYEVQIDVVENGTHTIYKKPFVLNQGEYSWDFNEGETIICVYPDLLFDGESVASSSTWDCDAINSSIPIHVSVVYPCQMGDQ